MFLAIGVVGSYIFYRTIPLLLEAFCKVVALYGRTGRIEVACY